MANKKLKQVYERERYRDAIRITDSVYIDILHAMRDEIDSILANNKNEE